MGQCAYIIPQRQGFIWYWINKHGSIILRIHVLISGSLHNGFTICNDNDAVRMSRDYQARIKIMQLLFILWFYTKIKIASPFGLLFHIMAPSSSIFSAFDYSLCIYSFRGKNEIIIRSYWLVFDISIESTDFSN